ncbi:hypothetical protein [Cohnella algarum]|uniref:hypothetical protein n=1 Tax=Cohnella algarum TaxID=2044859 RepID=UPI0030842646
MAARTKKIAMLLVSFFVFASIGSFGPATVGASAETLTREVVFGGFEAEEGWTLSLGSEFPGAQGDFVRDPASFRSGARSGKLTGNFAGGGNYVALTRTLPAYEALELSFWVKTSDVSRLGFRMTDETGQVHQQRISLQSTSDWQRISISVFDGGTQYSHWGGANDGVWHSPAKQISFVFDRSGLTGGKNSGVIRFDDVVMTATVPDLELQQDRPGNVFAVGEPVSLRALTSGDSVVSAVYDYWGNPVSVQTDPTGGGYANIALAGLESGYYTVNVTALRGGSPLREATTSLAVLPRSILARSRIRRSAWRRTSGSPGTPISFRCCKKRGRKISVTKCTGDRWRSRKGRMRSRANSKRIWPARKRTPSSRSSSSRMKIRSTTTTARRIPTKEEKVTRITDGRSRSISRSKSNGSRSITNSISVSATAATGRPIRSRKIITNC